MGKEDWLFDGERADYLFLELSETFIWKVKNFLESEIKRNLSEALGELAAQDKKIEEAIKYLHNQKDAFIAEKIGPSETSIIWLECMRALRALGASHEIT